MKTAIDTNVLIALWDDSDMMNTRALNALDAVSRQGKLVVSGIVFAELLGGQGRTVEMVESFLSDTGIGIDWLIDETVWRSSATAFQKYAKRRRKQKQPEPRRLVTDFLVGAHAFERGYSLLTFDDRIFRAAFPKLKLIS